MQFEKLLVPETLYVQSKVCMAPFHVRSKVCIAPIHVRRKVCKFAPHMGGSNADFALHMEGSHADVAPHMEGSHADFAPHMERRHSFRDQIITKMQVLHIVKRELFKTTNILGVFWICLATFNNKKIF